MTKKKQKSFELVTNNWVSKSNALNEVRNNRMTVSQIRLFTIYLSKINPKDINSREVTFKLDEYTKIMQFKQTNTTRLIKTAEDLLKLTVKYWDRTGEYSSDGLIGFVICQIFKRFKLYKDDNGEWVVSINCHDDVLHLMFDLQKYYFKYELWNALQLTSPNQQRMYELLKQYETAGERIVTIKDLREWLGLNPKEYSRWSNFKIRILDTSQEALANFTDIKFTWEVEKRGTRGKIIALKFNIEKNDNYIRQFTLNEFLIEQDPPKYENEPEEFERPEDDENPYYKDRIEFFCGACDDKFSFNHVKILDAKLRNNLPPDKYKDQIYCYHYLNDRYNEMIRQSERRTIENPFGYVKRIIGEEI